MFKVREDRKYNTAISLINASINPISLENRHISWVTRSRSRSGPLDSDLSERVIFQYFLFYFDRSTRHSYSSALRRTFADFVFSSLASVVYRSRLAFLLLLPMLRARRSEQAILTNRSGPVLRVGVGSGSDINHSI